MKTDATDRQRPEVELRREIRLLGFELGHVIRAQEGSEVYDLVERIRALSKQRRAGDGVAGGELDGVIAGLTPRQLAAVIRAFSCFFDLANIAEDRQRVRVLRRREREAHPGPRPESIAATIRQLHEAGTTEDAMLELLAGLDVELVFTAHPTEAKRRTVRRTLRRLREDLAKLDGRDVLPREREAVLRRIRSDITCLWNTDPLRAHRPTVIDEVKQSLFTLDSLWEVIPDLYRDVRESMSRCYDTAPDSACRFLRFGSWIGGDRDGNPFVTPEVTEQTLQLMRQRTIARHIAQCDYLSSVLTLSSQYHSPSDALLAAVKDARTQSDDLDTKLARLHPAETYRQWLAVIRDRLVATETASCWWQDDSASGSRYLVPADLMRDLRLMQSSLAAAGQGDLAQGELQAWLDRVTVFGFQFARLDIREHAIVLRDCVAELSGALEITDQYGEFTEAQRIAVLSELPPVGSCRSLDPESLSQATERTLRLFLLLDRLMAQPGGREAIGVFIVSMTRSASDVLAVLWLSRVAALIHGRQQAEALSIAPLFETIDDLHRSNEIFDQMLSQEGYREHVRSADDRQVCMIGYSDSAKDGGYLAANWALHEAQRRLADVAGAHGVTVTFFHGRGGSLGRGGGPTARSILGLPPQTLGGRLRMTEQGEVLAERYDDPEIARRHLEQVITATLRVTAQPVQKVDPQWKAILDVASKEGFEAYRDLISREGFVEYFQNATPIAGIERLPIGSRPARRGGQRTIDDLRAIPFTFAWTQNRHYVNAIFGLGIGLTGYAERDLRQLQRMYREWPWFRSLIDNGELALAKADMTIAAHYAGAHKKAGGGGDLFKVIEDEIQRARRLVLAITGEEEPLAAVPWLRASIETRNPYVDPLNLIQVNLMAKLRDPRLSDGESRVMENLLRYSIQGVAGGLRTTG